MKTIVTALLAVLLCLSLFACGTTAAVNNEIPGGPGHTAPIVSLEETLPPAGEDSIASTWTSGGITLSLLQDTYPIGTQKLTMVLENRGNSVLTYGEVISFEKYTDGQWKPVKTIGQYTFDSIAHELQPGSVSTFTLDAWFVDKPFDAGLYRVTGGEVWTDTQHTDGPAWQLEFRVADGAQPEPDFSIYVSAAPLQMAETIPVHIINTTGEENSILWIPHLERQNISGQWEEVPFADGVGFCGMSDPLPAGGDDLSAPVQTLWGSLEAGRYRISYDITGSGTAVRTAGGEFVLEQAYTPADALQS
ncbi:MAG: hypothetical protein K2O18_18135 [Oscillospiraceae bacterium]|nr:hypothetical protein [Oscillospiraceae bacterium]